ncbi:hypothetical protein GCM10027586_21080 [Kineococcus gypseus]|uniref:hypothetical protein n=1 Tax=Kineococcus gypseus TaxID=1637102 RepID=UPI003D7E1324
MLQQPSNWCSSPSIELIDATGRTPTSGGGVVPQGLTFGAVFQLLVDDDQLSHLGLARLDEDVAIAPLFEASATCAP